MIVPVDSGSSFRLSSGYAEMNGETHMTKKKPGCLRLAAGPACRTVKANCFVSNYLQEAIASGVLIL
jgi:hypothetical protein